MSRPKKNVPPVIDLLPLPPGAAAAPAPPPSAELPPVVDFRLDDRQWRIERFMELAAEYHLGGSMAVAGGLAGWADTAREFVVFAREHTRQWVLVRRLFGVGPVIPPAGTHPDDLRVWTRPELAAEGFAVPAELDALRALWSAHTRREAGAAQPETTRTAVLTPPAGELALDDQLLAKFNFSERIFRITVWDPLEGAAGKDVPRAETENRAERDWFIGRVRTWAKMLGDPLAGPIARDALMNDLYLRRLEAEIATAGRRDMDRLYDRKQALSRDYQEKVERLQQMFPEMAVAGKVSFRGMVSDLILAHRDYYANGDRRLVDKVMTAAELEFALRTSLQVGSRHRLTLNLVIQENIHNLWNPEFRSQFKPWVLKLVEAGARGLIEAAREAQREPVVDLEKGVAPGEGDQFEDYNDAACPECAERISSSAVKCPHCGMDRPNDTVKEIYA